ncbi:hypothetical protein H4R34_002288 [Dimargaris verticillata]|uniref:Uncharacterized protein n=1 Tax=Dimargaris verticillata TaxID=2761393 RepID=A0A9W8B8E0_9FUNG|nr:hypothetical protein H4R34_002288 [Dimargaris verticillata]
MRRLTPTRWSQAVPFSKASTAHLPCDALEVWDDDLDLDIGDSPLHLGSLAATPVNHQHTAAAYSSDGLSDLSDLEDHVATAESSTYSARKAAAATRLPAMLNTPTSVSATAYCTNRDGDDDHWAGIEFPESLGPLQLKAGPAKALPRQSLSTDDGHEWLEDGVLAESPAVRGHSNLVWGNTRQPGPGTSVDLGWARPPPSLASIPTALTHLLPPSATAPLDRSPAPLPLAPRLTHGPRQLPPFSHDPSASTKRPTRKRPLLIRNLNSHKIAKTIGDMVYDPVRQTWVGNEAALTVFPRDGPFDGEPKDPLPLRKSDSSPMLPHLGLASIPKTPRRIQRIVSYEKGFSPHLKSGNTAPHGMVFDSSQMRWINTNQTDEEEDVFADIADLEDDHCLTGDCPTSTGSSIASSPSVRRVLPPSHAEAPARPPTVTNTTLARLAHTFQRVLRSHRSTPNLQPRLRSMFQSHKKPLVAKPASLGSRSYPPPHGTRQLGPEFTLSRDQKAQCHAVESAHRQWLAGWLPDRRARSGSILLRDHLAARPCQRDYLYLYDIIPIALAQTASPYAASNPVHASRGP